MSRKHALAGGLALTGSPPISVEMSIHCDDRVFKQGWGWGTLGTVREVVCSVLGLRRTRKVCEEKSTKTCLRVVVNHCNCQLLPLSPLPRRHRLRIGVSSLLIAVSRVLLLWVGYRQSQNGHCATVATTLSTPESCRSLEMVLPSRYAWVDWVGVCWGRVVEQGPQHACRRPQTLPTCLSVRSRTHVTKTSPPSRNQMVLGQTCPYYPRFRKAFSQPYSSPLRLIQVNSGQEL
jgi:hypothetical protein